MKLYLTGFIECSVGCKFSHASNKLEQCWRIPNLILLGGWWKCCQCNCCIPESFDIAGDRVVQLPEDSDHSVEKLGNHVRPVIGPTWKETLCNENKVGDPGSPVVLVLCSSAIRCVELLRWARVIFRVSVPNSTFAWWQQPCFVNSHLFHYFWVFCPVLV